MAIDPALPPPRSIAFQELLDAASPGERASLKRLAYPPLSHRSPRASWSADDVALYGRTLREINRRELEMVEARKGGPFHQPTLMPDELAQRRRRIESQKDELSQRRLRIAQEVDRHCEALEGVGVRPVTQLERKHLLDYFAEGIAAEGEPTVTVDDVMRRLVILRSDT